MIFFIYNVFLTLFLLLVSPYFFLLSLFQNSLRKSLPQRMGFFQNRSLPEPIWVHAASVGEVRCSIPLLKRMKKEFPQIKIILTTMTSTGNKLAKTSLPEVDQVLFTPIDHALIVRKVVKKIQPALLLIAETELWPNLLRSCGKRAIPIVLFNGRISQKAFPKYRFFRFFFKECLKYPSLFLMQTEEDRNRIIQMGGASDKTKVVGNLKFDQTFPRFTEEDRQEIAESLGLVGNEHVLIAGSTHPGEEEIMVDLYKKLIKLDPHLVLVLAPRHLERLEEVEKIFRKESVLWQRKTSSSPNGSPSDPGRSKIILLDTMGELMKLYSLGTLVFIGGSLVPVGGHNPLEALFFKKCVLWGPHMFNFSEISRQLIEGGGAIGVSGKDELFSKIKHLLFDETARNEIGEKGYQFLQRHRGATERVFEEIRPFLSKKARSV